MSETAFTIHIEHRDESGRVVRAFDGTESTNVATSREGALAAALAAALRAMTDRRRSPLDVEEAAWDLVSCLAWESDIPILKELSRARDGWAFGHDFETCVKVVVDEDRLKADGSETEGEAKGQPDAD